MNKVGMEPRFINGLRVTDKDTMEIAEMVLAKVNKELVTLVESLGVQAVGISGKDGGRSYFQLVDTNFDSYNINADDAACAIANWSYMQKNWFSSLILKGIQGQKMIRIH